MKNEFMVCWEANGKKQWEIVSGEDVLQRVLERIVFDAYLDNNSEPENIFVYFMKDEINNRKDSEIIVQTPLGILKAQECGDDKYPGIAVKLIRNGNSETADEVVSITEFNSYKNDFSVVSYCSYDDGPVAIVDYNIPHPWELIDADSMFHIRNDGYEMFTLIKMIPEENGLYGVYLGQECVDTILYCNENKRLEAIVKELGCDTVEDVERKYGEKTNKMLVTTAFNLYGYLEANKIFTGRKEQAKDFIITRIEY